MTKPPEETPSTVRAEPFKPGPTHPIRIDRKDERARVFLGSETLVDAATYLSLQEASYSPVAYLPREAADMNRLVPSDTRTHCPYKGNASYFHVRRPDGTLIEDVFWSYETPKPEVDAIRDHLAVYTNRIDRLVFGED